MVPEPGGGCYVKLSNKILTSNLINLADKGYFGQKHLKPFTETAS